MNTDINIDHEMAQLEEGWRLSEDRRKISKEYQLPDFLPALDFVRKVGEEAEKIDHHPDIHIFLRKVVFDLTTFDADGKLTDLDFQTAKAIDGIYNREYKGAKL